MGIISKKFNIRITTLKNDYELNRQVAHQGIKGNLNEIEIASLINEVIPQKYKISKGIVENYAGEQSNETDFFIYDDEILPPYVKNDVTFVPIEAVKYVFEIKSTLTSTEVKSTISKFEKFASMGGRSPTVLYSFSSDTQGSELERYKKYEDNFYTYPSVMSLCVSNKGYYYKDVAEHYLKDHLSVEDYINIYLKNNNLSNNIKENLSSILENEELLNYLSRSQIANLIKSSILADGVLKNLNEKDLTINGVKYSEIKFKVHKWIGIESSENIVELSLLSGVSNTLCKQNFGNYLLHNHKLDLKVFSICYEDMWGNLSCKDFDPNGLKYDFNNVEFTYSSTSDSNTIIFKKKQVDE